MTAESITVEYGGTNLVYTDICVKLEGSKLLEVTYSLNFNGITAVIKIDNVGSTSVTIPAISE